MINEQIYHIAIYSQKITYFFNFLILDNFNCLDVTIDSIYDFIQKVQVDNISSHVFHTPPIYNEMH